MNNLSRLRDAKGLSQRDLADIIGVSQPTILRAEKEDPTAKLGTYKKCADYFGVTLAELFGHPKSISGPLMDMIQRIDPEDHPRLMTLISLARVVPLEGGKAAMTADDPQE